MPAKPPHIAFDATLLATPTPSGVEQAIRRTLEIVLAEAGDWRFTVYAARPLGLDSANAALHDCPLARAGRGGRIFWQQCALPRRLRLDGADLLHAPGYVAPLLPPCPTVLTVYDVLAITRPDLGRWANTLHYSLAMRASAKRAARVMVPSEHVRGQVVAVLGVPENKVRVVPLPLRDFSAARLGEGDLLAVKRRYGLPERFVLYVGNVEPKKNVATLVRAFAAMKREGGLDCKLVLAGRWAWGCRAVRRAIAEEKAGGDIVETGYVADEDLPALYRLASLFVFPSLEEGFGLPPLEAMSMGAPVVASDAASLPEVLGGAALLVPPDDARPLRIAMRKVLVNRFLREALRERGLRRAGQFDPAGIARRVLGVYEEVLSGGGTDGEV